MIEYNFLAPSQIVFGWGRRAELGRLAGTLGRRALLVCGSRTLERSGHVGSIADLLTRSGIQMEQLATIAREPEVGDVDKAVARVREITRPGDFVLSLGGGSAIDLAKAVAALATNTHGAGVADFLEGVGKGLNIEHDPLPVLAMPTTAGTGSEATKNAVISSSDPAFKKSLRSERMIPRIVLVDPELTVGLPPQITAHTGMDAVTQLIESYISRRSQPIPDALCLQGIELALPAVTEAYENGTSRTARTRMAHAALLSGLALANSGLGFAHGVAASLGVSFGVPHGLACAVMLPVAMRINRDVAASKLAQIGRITAGRLDLDESSAVEHAIHTVDQLCARLAIPRRLSDLGVTAAEVPQLALGSRGNSMNGNPRDLSNDEIVRILEDML